MKHGLVTNFVFIGLLATLHHGQFLHIPVDVVILRGRWCFMVPLLDNGGDDDPTICKSRQIVTYTVRAKLFGLIQLLAWN